MICTKKRKIEKIDKKDNKTKNNISDQKLTKNKESPLNLKQKQSNLNKESINDKESINNKNLPKEDSLIRWKLVFLTFRILF